MQCLQVRNAGTRLAGLLPDPLLVYRKKRGKCDGRVPICSSCEASGTQCEVSCFPLASLVRLADPPDAQYDLGADKRK